MMPYSGRQGAGSAGHAAAPVERAVMAGVGVAWEAGASWVDIRRLSLKKVNKLSMKAQKELREMQACSALLDASREDYDR